VKKWGGVYHVISADDIQIHISKSKSPAEQPELSSKAKKLMHRFTEEEVEAKMDDAESETN